MPDKIPDMTKEKTYTKAVPRQRRIYPDDRDMLDR